MPATKAKIRQGAKSRKKLVKAATEILGREGYSGFSIDRIVRTAKVNRSALYWHFDSKNGLLVAALAEISRLWVEEFAEETAQAGSPMERLDVLVRRARYLITDAPEHRRMTFSLLLERGDHDVEVRSGVAELFDHRRDALVLGFSQATGLDPAQLGPVADTVIHMADGLLLRYLADGDLERLDAVLNEMRVYLMQRFGALLRNA